MELWGPNIDKSAVSDAADRVRFQLGQADKLPRGADSRRARGRHYIKKTMTEAGLPREIASLPHVESSFNPAARSKVGAAGMWQFMSVDRAGASCASTTSSTSASIRTNRPARRRC